MLDFPYFGWGDDHGCQYLPLLPQPPLSNPYSYIIDPEPNFQMTFYFMCIVKRFIFFVFVGVGCGCGFVGQPF